MLTACGGTSSSEQTSAPTTSATTISVSEATSESTEKTTAATTTADTSIKESKPETFEEETIETPVEHEKIVPIAIEPQSIPEDASIGLSELAIINTYVCSLGHFMEYAAVSGSFFTVASSLDAPLPNSTFIKKWGCYPNCITDGISNSSYSSQIIAEDLSNYKIEDIYAVIDNNTPVAVWVTDKLAKPELIAEAEGIKMYDPHEVVILVGYSDTQVMVWSPFQDDYITYDRALFEQRFEELGSYALTITAK